jgi:hypothetical protein
MLVRIDQARQNVAVRDVDAANCGDATKQIAAHHGLRELHAGRRMKISGSDDRLDSFAARDNHHVGFQRSVRAVDERATNVGHDLLGPDRLRHGVAQYGPEDRRARRRNPQSETAI